MASDKYFTTLKDGQLAIATVAQSGSIIPEPGKDPAKYTTCLVQTDDGVQQCVKTVDLNGGGGGGGGADTSLSNLTDAGKIVAAKMSMPGSVYDDLTPVSNQLYTAPADGWVVGASATSGAIFFGDDGQGLSNNPCLSRFGGHAPGAIMQGTIPILKGQEFCLIFTDIPLVFRFVYAKGSESEKGA